MEIVSVESGGEPTLRIAGRLDAVRAPAFGERLMAMLAAAETPPVLDFGGVDYISSGGLRVLLQAAKLVQQRGGRLTLTQVLPQVHAILKLSGFGTFMTFRQTG